MLNSDSINKLIKINKNDDVVLSMLYDGIFSFEDYHLKIYKMETWSKIYDYNNMSREGYQAKLTELDKSRSLCHNSVIASIDMLNRHCEQNNIPLVYEGIVSKERPFRVQIADAVLDYVDETVKKRKK